MYDKNYAKIWIDNYESGKDTFRTDYLEPYFEKVFGTLPENARILDVGCGWGTVVSFIKPTHIYYGVDITTDFFDYIRKKFQHPNITLAFGGLPNKVNVEDSSFDFGVCSLVMHAIPNLELSIQTLFDKIKSGGRVLIIDFNDKAEEPLRNEVFNPIYEETEKYIRGEAILPSGLRVSTEAYFYKENEYENIISKYGYYNKKELGPLFVAYECIKK